VHCVAVYNYYSRNSRFVTFERDGHYFVGPDNGVFSLIFDDLRPDQVYEIDQQLLGLDTISKVIGWTVGYLSKGNPIAEKCHHQPQAGSVRATASWATLPDILQADWSDHRDLRVIQFCRYYRCDVLIQLSGLHADRYQYGQGIHHA